MKTKKYIRVTDSDLDRVIVIKTQLAEVIMLSSLLADVSMGLLPDKHFDEKHHMFYHHFSKLLFDLITKALE